MSRIALLVLCWSAAVATGNVLTTAWTRAIRQTLYEQEVEDCNAVHRIDNHLVRRLIVMPLTEGFSPHQVNGMHGKVQYGDKCSLPATIGRLIFEKPYEVPWLFEITPVNQTVGAGEETVTVTVGGGGSSSSREAEKRGAAAKDGNDDDVDDDDAGATTVPSEPRTIEVRRLPKAYISPLDFRSPENYIFLPRWLMATLGVKVNDLVDVSFIRIKLASLVVLQPLTLDWDAMILKSGRDPKTVLEQEVNKYSSLTAGATVYIEVDGVELPLLVKETYAEGGVSVRGVRVQDSDIKVDVDRSVLDALLKAQKEAEEATEEAAKAAKADAKARR